MYVFERRQRTRRRRERRQRQPQPQRNFAISPVSTQANMDEPLLQLLSSIDYQKRVDRKFKSIMGDR